MHLEGSEVTIIELSELENEDNKRLDLMIRRGDVIGVWWGEHVVGLVSRATFSGKFD